MLKIKQNIRIKMKKSTVPLLTTWGGGGIKEEFSEIVYKTQNYKTNTVIQFTIVIFK